VPLYAYSCGADGIFEAYATRDDSYMPCPTCRQPARRRPFSGVPNLKGETVARSIPDPHYRQDALAKEHRQTYGGVDKAMEHIRSGIRETDTGRVFDPKQANPQTA
jgi:hypothetical protein